MNDWFRRFANSVSCVTGSPWAFSLAVATILIWAVSGPMFGFSDTWQLVINTGTTIVTFLMVFLIQNTQNRDNKALQLKLDELLRAVAGARTGMVDLEDLSDEQLDHLRREFQELAQEHGDIPAVTEALEEELQERQEEDQREAGEPAHSGVR